MRTPAKAKTKTTKTRAQTLPTAQAKRRDSSWLFNLGADVYAWFTAQRAWRASCAELSARLQLTAGARVLDLGCGPGVSTFALSAKLPDAQLIGVDVAPRMLAQAQRRAPARLRVTWLQADAARLPIGDECVNACTGHSFLYLVADRSAVLQEIQRVLRPGGQLVLMEPNARAASVPGALRVSRDPRHLVSVSLWRPFSRLHGRFTPQSLVAVLQEHGFVDCHADETFGGLGLLASATKP